MMNAKATYGIRHELPLILQAVGYVAFALSLEQQVEPIYYRKQVQSPCSCGPEYEGPRLLALIEKTPECGDTPDEPDALILKQPFGEAAEHWDVVGGYRYA